MQLRASGRNIERVGPTMNGPTVCGIILAVIVAILAALPLTLPPLVELDNYVVMCPLPGPSFTPWPDPNYRLARGS